SSCVDASSGSINQFGGPMSDLFSPISEAFLRQQHIVPGDPSIGHTPQPRAARCGARHHGTIFISDVHLATRGGKAEALANFLTRNSCDTLFLVSDIVD